MRIPSEGAGGMAPVSAGVAEEPPFKRQRLGRDVSWLEARERSETALQHAVTTVAGLIAAPYQAIDGEGPAGRPVDEHSLKDYVRASLGMEHDAAKIDPDLAPHLDELSKVGSTEAQPVTESSFRLLCILHMADQVPGPAAYGKFSRDAFMNWLGEKLAPDTVRYDCIPERYFDEVQVRRNPEAGLTNRCAVRLGPDLAHSVDVRAMHGADLRETNLQGADLRGADLRSAKLAGAHLESAYLEGADLRGSNLEGAGLAYARLKGAKLQDANLRGAYLESAQLIGAHLEGADLPGVSLQGADLQGASLQGADLAGAHLEGADLRETNLQGADLRRTNLQGASLGGANLEDADLEDADLEDAHLQFAYLRGANLQDANLTGANLQGANLEDASLEEACLEGANFEGADLQGADLEYTDLAGANLRDAKLERTLLRHASLQGLTLSVTPAMAVRIVRNSRNMTGARLVLSTGEAASSCQRHVAARMASWIAEEFDEILNHRNNNGRGMLKNIAGLDDSCRDMKQALMRAVVGELDRERATPRAAAVARLIPSLGDVLFEDPEYLRGHDAFSAWLCAGLLGNGSTLLDPTLSDAALDAVGGHVVRLLAAEGIDAVAGHSVAIYQVLYAMRERAASSASPEVGEKWTAQSQALHEQYCRALGDALPTLMGEGGVYENERDVVLTDDDAFPLISADGRSCVIMTDQYYRQLVLGVRFDGERNCAWADLRCVAAVGAGPDRTFPANVNDVGQGGTRGTVAIIDQFPLLRAASRRENAAVAQGRMLALAGLPAGGEFKFLERFMAALQRRSISGPQEKMIDDRHQLRLGEIFGATYANPDGQGAQLVPEHFTALRAQWPDDTERTFAFRLLCMATLYTNYSSSRFFGIEEESPNALRGYTEALLRKAHELAPELLQTANPQPGQPPVDQLGDWLQRLNGNAFDCTAVLYDIQSGHLNNLLGQEADNGPLHRVRDAMIPLAWR